MITFAINGTDLINNPFNTTVSAFVNLLGNGFYLIPLTFIAAALYMKTRNFVMVSAFILASSILLVSGSIFANYPEMAGVYAIFIAFGIAGVVLGLYFDLRRD